eukprot:275097-Rhodomonas_salina.3
MPRDPRFESSLPPRAHRGDAETRPLFARFETEPETPELTLQVRGTWIILPKYNGIQWWWPKTTNHPAADFFVWFFTIVNTQQTFSIFLWIAIIIYRFGLLYSSISLPLLVPLGSHLEDTHGPNYGSAYSSIHTLYVTFCCTAWFVASRSDDFSPNWIVFAIAFVMLLFAVGDAFAYVEKHVLGRTWFAAVVAYAHIGVWDYQLWGLVFG